MNKTKKARKKKSKKSTGRGDEQTIREQNKQTHKKIPGSGTTKFQS
jgi:hypothetical protein